jgi:uncharacterized membrane protein YesL
MTRFWWRLTLTLTGLWLFGVVAAVVAVAAVEQVDTAGRT